MPYAYGVRLLMEDAVNSFGMCNDDLTLLEKKSNLHFKVVQACSYNQIYFFHLSFVIMLYYHMWLSCKH